MELLEALRLYKKETDKIEAQEREVQKLPDPENGGTLTRLIVSVILSLIISTLILTIMGKTVLHTDSPVEWLEYNYGGFGLLCMFTVPAAIIYIFWTMNVNKKKQEIQKKIQIEKTKLEKIRLECKNNMKLIGVIPEYYHYGEGIRLFIRYIESMQASTLQECIKLYHEEMRHRESMAAMDSIYSNLDSLGSKLDSIDYEVNRTHHKPY